MAESQHAQLTREIISAVSAFDFEKVHRMVTDDLVVEQTFPALGQPERYQGREAFVEGLSLVPTMFTSFDFTITGLYDVPACNTVIFEMKSEGVFKVDGSPYHQQYVIFFHFRDGLVDHWKEYYNPEIMNTVMGAALAKMQAG